MENRMIPHNLPTIGREEAEAAYNSLMDLELTIGNKIDLFEEGFGNYTGLGAAACSSGTSALHLALIALGIGDNDEVILPAYTCVTVPLPVLYQRAIPILCDVSDDYNISADS